MKDEKNADIERLYKVSNITMSLKIKQVKWVDYVWRTYECLIHLDSGDQI